MATLSTQHASLTGTAITMATAAGGGDKFHPGEGVMLLVTNGDSSSHTVTIDSKQLSNFGTDENVAVAVAAGATRLIGPLPASRFAGSDGLGDISYSAATSMTIAALA